MATCRLLPQGAYPLVPTVLTTMAWIASLFQDECDYVRLEGEVVSKLGDAPWVEAGIKAYRQPRQNRETGVWEVSYTGKCLQYPPSLVDTDETVWKVSEAFAFMALVLGGGGTFFLWFSTCCTFSRGTWRWAGYEVFLASVCQAVSFVFFQTTLCQENTCNLFWGSRSDILSVIFWFVASMCIFCHYPLPRGDDDDDEPDGIIVSSTDIIPPRTHDLTLEEEVKVPNEEDDERVTNDDDREYTMKRHDDKPEIV